MNINLSPQRRDDSLAVSVSGDVLSINGEAFDFSQMVDGDTLPASAIESEWFVDQVNKIGNDIFVTLILPLPANYSHAQAFPAPLFNLPNGPVAFPQPLPASTEDLAGLDGDLEA